jgi:hypothetical protein
MLSVNRKAYKAYYPNCPHPIADGFREYLRNYFQYKDTYGIPGFEPIEKSEISSIDAKQLGDFCGSYQYHDDKLTITMHDDKLFLSYPYTKEMQLHKEENNLYFVQGDL